jgi:hypothetical protein
MTRALSLALVLVFSAVGIALVSAEAGEAQSCNPAVQQC